MDKRIVCAMAVTTFIAAGCAEKIDDGTYDNDIRYLNAWLKQDHEELGITIDRNPETNMPDTLGRGVYLLSETEGTGVKASKGDYVRIRFVKTGLSGTVNASSEESIARQLGTYDRTYYYGPRTFSLTAGTNTAGFIDGIKGMKEGGKRNILIPEWLDSTEDYSTEAEFLEKSTSSDHYIYTITLEKVIKDFDQYRKDEIEAFLKDKVYGKLQYDDGTYVTDVKAVEEGFYFIPVTDTTGHRTFPSDTTVYINYTGSRLDGQTFDTTIEKVALDNWIWSSSKTYEETKITWGASAGEIKMDGSSVISGFSKTIWQMNKGTGIGIFWSDLGYGSSSSGNRIPAYAPLMFKVEFVDEEEE